MQLTIKKQLWFTRSLTGMSPSWKKARPGQPVLSRYNLYLTCSELPLERFIRCLCNGEYSLLLRKGTAPEHILQQAWEKIYSEYVELDGSTQTLYVNQLRRDIMLLSSRIDRVIHIVNVLDMAPNAILIAELKELRFPFNYDYSDFLQYRKDLVATIHRLAPWRLEFNKLEKELNAVIAANENGPKMDRSYFDNALARLSRFNQYQVKAINLTVSEFVTMLKQYLQYIDQTKKAHGKQRENR